MSVKVLFFASCREAVGKKSLFSISSYTQLFTAFTFRFLPHIYHPPAGLERTEVVIPPDITAAQCDTVWLMQQILASYPDLEPLVSTVRLAVNRKYIRFDVEVKAGDEVALIPPISGG